MQLLADFARVSRLAKQGDGCHFCAVGSGGGRGLRAEGAAGTRPGGGDQSVAAAAAAARRLYWSCQLHQ